MVHVSIGCSLSVPHHYMSRLVPCSSLEQSTFQPLRLRTIMSASRIQTKPSIQHHLAQLCISTCRFAHSNMCTHFSGTRNIGRFVSYPIGYSGGNHDLDVYHCTRAMFDGKLYHSFTNHVYENTRCGRHTHTQTIHHRFVRVKIQIIEALV